VDGDQSNRNTGVNDEDAIQNEPEPESSKEDPEGEILDIDQEIDTSLNLNLTDL
jgi:hypothetical protein